MKALLTLVLSLVLIICDAQNIPDFTLTDTHGQSHHLYDYLQQKQAVVIDFFLESCGNCGPAAVLLEQVYQDYGQNQGWIKVLGMECDTAPAAEVDAWMDANGATYPAIYGPDARTYWMNNWQPLLGGVFNQCIGIFPTAFTNPQTSYLDFIYIGLMTSTQQQELIDKLHQYGFYAGFSDLPRDTDTLSVWPNPAGNAVTVFVQGLDMTAASYQVIDVAGRPVTSGQLEGEIETGALAPGLYTLLAGDGTKLIFTRFMKL